LAICRSFVIVIVFVFLQENPHLNLQSICQTGGGTDDFTLAHKIFPADIERACAAGRGKFVARSVSGSS